MKDNMKNILNLDIEIPSDKKDIIKAFCGLIDAFKEDINFIIDDTKLDFVRLDTLLKDVEPIDLNKEESDNLKVEYEHFTLNKILEYIDNINFVITSKIDSDIENKVFKSAIRMNIINIDEQFSKLKYENSFKILQNFESEDLKAINKARNLIEYNYDDIEDELVENIFKEILPKLKIIIENLK